MIKNQNGITLIVLIVTILLLLIIAAVTISSISGGDGILNYARNESNTVTSQIENLHNKIGTLYDEGAPKDTTTDGTTGEGSTDDGTTDGGSTDDGTTGGGSTDDETTGEESTSGNTTGSGSTSVCLPHTFDSGVITTAATCASTRLHKKNLYKLWSNTL